MCQHALRQSVQNQTPSRLKGGCGRNDDHSRLALDDKLRQSGGGSGTLYYLQDHLGSTIALTSTMGGIVQPTQQYEPFGASSGSLQTRYGFTGREQDATTGLTYYRARWSDPYLGRFLSEDQFGFEDDINLYSYGLNNPLSFTDPLGLYVSWDPTGCSGLGCVHDAYLGNACPQGDCEEIKEDMKKLSDSIRNRRIDRRKWLNIYKAKGYKNPHTHPDTKDIVGRHQRRINNEEAALAKCKFVYEDSNCDDCPNVPVPVPVPVQTPKVNPNRIPRIPLWQRVPIFLRVLPVILVFPCPMRPGCTQPTEKG